MRENCVLHRPFVVFKIRNNLNIAFPKTMQKMYKLATSKQIKWTVKLKIKQILQHKFFIQDFLAPNLLLL